MNPMLLSDYYKTDHRRQYPSDTEVIYSNFTPRNSRIDGVNHVVVFGLQYFLKEFLINRFNKDFFCRPFDQVVNEYQRVMDYTLGKGAFPLDHIEDLHRLGYLPLEIKSLPEGSLCPLRVPMLTVRNTIDKFFWLPNFIESLLSNTIWQATTVATIARQYKLLLDEYASETSDIPEFTQWQGHDFSFRGHTSSESAAVAGMGHLLSFTGTDTIPSIPYLEKYYNANIENELVGSSVSATEHSTMTCMGEEGEFDIIKRLITEVYPNGNISIVADSYNLWRVLTEYLPKLKNEIISRNGKVICRPDSGNPVKIICGRRSPGIITTDCYNPEDEGVIKLLYKVFGGEKNYKGYIQLNPKVGTIYGDSITLDRCKAICEGLKSNGFASTNMVFGIGSYTYQYLTRDTFGLAFKATCIKRNKVWYPIFKDPVTDNGTKKSARGLLMVMPDLYTKEFVLHENVSEELEQSSWNCLRPVFRDGLLLKEFSLNDIRHTINRS